MMMITINLLVLYKIDENIGPLKNDSKSNNLIGLTPNTPKHTLFP